jgi:acyl-CoA hydrolase
MVELGWVAACKYAEDYVIIEDLTNIYFKKPVDVGSRLTLKSRVTYVK